MLLARGPVLKQAPLLAFKPKIHYSQGFDLYASLHESYNLTNSGSPITHCEPACKFITAPASKHAAWFCKH